MSYQGVLDQIAKAAGGNQPDAVNLPRFFSGKQMNGGAGDGSGLSSAGNGGIKGCWSAPPDQILDLPMGVVVPGRFTVPVGVQGWEENTDYPILYILIARGDSVMSYTDLIPFRDSAVAAFRNKLTLSGTVNVQASITDGRPVVVTFGGEDFVAWEMTVTCLYLVQNPGYAT